MTHFWYLNFLPRKFISSVEIKEDLQKPSSVLHAFISNVRLKLAKKRAKAKQHPEAELLLFENHSLSTSTLSSNNNRRYSKKRTKKQVRLFKQDYMINGNKNEAENE